MMRQTEAVSSPLADQQAAVKKKRSAQTFWRRYFYFYDTLNESAPYRQMVGQHANNLDANRDDLILDAGTGTGNVAVILLAQGARLIGIDFCEEALERCREKDARGDFRFGDITQPLDFQSNYFDKVSCCNVFQFLNSHDHRAALGELFRVLKPGGLFSITVFGAGFSSAKVYRETLRAKRKDSSIADTLLFGIRYSFSTLRILYYVWRIKKQEASGEYYFFDSEELSRLLKDTGFEVLKLQRVFASQCITAVAKKPLPSPISD
jgi:ubiquinone/menaquinone biosynthesis C-methylase UbiE